MTKDKTSENDYESRIEQARENFLEGYNCSQSVVLAFADLYGLSKETALRISASFGGGMGRMRETCGTVTGMFILAGLETGAINPKDLEGRGHNYAVVRQLAEKFKAENGTLNCSILLGLKEGEKEPPAPSERTREYYLKRPCPNLARCAAKISADFLKTYRTNKK